MTSGPIRFLSVTLFGLLTVFSIIVPGSGDASSKDLAGIHYAPPRNHLHPNIWLKEMLQTYDCQAPCEIKLDDRLSAVHLRYKWMQLNPADGRYDFEALGEAIDLISDHGVNVTLIVMAGKYTPPWVFDSGARSYPLKFRFSRASEYSQPKMPLPWDDVYLDAYGKMLKALSAYLKEKPSRYEAVVLVKNGAIVSHSGETRVMPVKAFYPKSMKNDLHLREEKRDELCQAWEKVQYREWKIQDAMRRSNESLDKAFPEKKLGLAFVHGSNRFPTISSETGKCVPGGRNQTLEKLIKEMVVIYRNRAVVNSTTLYNNGGEPSVLGWARRNGGNVAFQLNRQQVGCHQKAPSTCDPDDLRDSLDKGIEQGAVFIEVHDGNVHRHQDILRDANDELKRSWQ